MIRLMFSLPLICVPFLLSAQDKETEPFLQNEVSVGMGGGFPLEKDPLNVPGEQTVPASFGLNIGYRRYLESNLAVGVRLNGYINKLPGYTITDQSNSTMSADFNFEMFNLSLEGLMLFSSGSVRPYALLMVGLAAGKLSHDELGNLSLSGIAGGGGLGVQFEISQTVAIAIEGLGSFGSAKWEKKPFSNSAGDEFNPAVFMALANVLIRFP